MNKASIRLGVCEKGLGIGMHFKVGNGDNSNGLTSGEFIYLSYYLSIIGFKRPCAHRDTLPELAGLGRQVRWRRVLGYELAERVA